MQKKKKKLQGHKNLLAILMDSKVICGSNKKIKTYLALKFLKQKKSVLTHTNKTGSDSQYCLNDFGSLLPNEVSF